MTRPQQGALWKLFAWSIRPRAKSPYIIRMFHWYIVLDIRILGLPGVKKYGATLMTDGATIQRHPLVNVVLNCVSFSAVMLVGVIDASEHLASGASKDAEYVTNQIIPTKEREKSRKKCAPHTSTQHHQSTREHPYIPYI